MSQSLQSAAGVLGLYAEPTRLRLLALVESEALSVSELTKITGVPQSRVSTHLGRLREAGLVLDQRRGKSTFYRMPSDASAAPMWLALRHNLQDETLQADRERARAVVRARGGASWVDEVAGQMERHYSPGRTWEAMARGLVPFLALGEVLDVGSGDGAMAALLAPRCERLTCLDKNERVLEAARGRLCDVTNVHFQAGDMHEMPFADECFDQVMCFNVLTYTERAQDVLRECARVLRPGGTLVVVTLDEHPHLDTAAAYDHVVAGFGASTLRRHARAAGLKVAQCAVTSRERKKPYFAVVTAVCHKPDSRPQRGPRP